MILTELLLVLGLTIVTPDSEKPTRIVAEATDVPEGGVLSLHLVEDRGRTGDEKLGPAIFAKVESTGSGLRLIPSFGLTRGSTYRVVIRMPDGRSISADHTVPAGATAAVPKVEKIFPTSKKVPANLLKFYLYFSEPMREARDVFDQIHIENDQGERVHAPWRRRQLWTDEARRLTLWIHPGRIKRGVNLREELGPVLEPNRRYTLVIDKTLRSASGTAIGLETRHEFSTLAEDYERPLPETWKLTAPPAGTRQPLKIESPEPLDHILIARHIKVFDPEGEPLAVKFELTPGEAAWTIRPEQPWKTGRHRLAVSEFLEDLAGNTRLRVFDTDLTRAPPEPGAEFLEFEPGS